MPPEILAKFDKDGDGKLNDEERAAAKAAAEAKMEERKKEMIAKFDKDGDGKLSDEEKKAAEEAAKAAYEELKGLKVKPCGFFDHFDIENFGASPDGLVLHDGLVETKCPTGQKHISWCLAGIVPEEHKPQMIVQLMCTGREWCDFVSFDPRVKGPKRLFVIRYTPTDEEIEKVRVAAIQFLQEAEIMFEFMSTEAA